MWKIIKASYFVRGAGTALALLTIFPNFLPFHALDLLAGTYYIIMKWNEFAGAVGKFLGEMFGIDEIAAEVITALIIALSIGPFYSLAILRSEWGQHTGVVQSSAFWIRALAGFFGVLLMTPHLFAAPPTDSFFWAALVAVLLPLLVALRILPAYRAGFLSVVGFVMFMEGAYFMGSEWVQEVFDNAVCKEEHSLAPRCQSTPDIP